MRRELRIRYYLNKHPRNLLMMMMSWYDDIDDNAV